METVFLVYKTDARHSYASRDVIGIATTIDEAISICIAQAKKEGRNKINKSALWDLQNLKQTQTYKGNGEFQFEEMKLNVLL